MRQAPALLAVSFFLTLSPTLEAQPVQKPVTHRARLVVGTGHSTYVLGLEADVTPDGKYLITGSFTDQTVRVWETATGREIRVFRGVTSLCVSRDLKTFACGSDDGTVRLWDLTTGKELRSFKGDGKPVETPYLTEDNKRLLAVNDAGGFRLWELDTGKLIRTMPGKNGHHFNGMSDDGRWFMTIGFDKTAIVWETATGKKAHELSNIADAELSADGKFAIAAREDGALELWDIAKAKVVRTFQEGVGKDCSDVELMLSRNGKRLVGGWEPKNTGADAKDEKTAVLWDVTTGKIMRRFADFKSMDLSEDSRWLTTCHTDGTVKLWDLENAKEIRTFKGHEDARTARISSDSKWLTTNGANGIVKLWDLASGKELRTFRSYSDAARLTVLSADGKWLANVCGDTTVHIWDLVRGKELRAFKGNDELVSCLAFSADGKWLATGGSDKTARLWNTASGALSRTCEGHKDAVSCLVLSADGKWLVTGNGDQTPKLLDVAGDGEPRDFQETDAAPRFGALSFDCLAISGNAKLLASMHDGSHVVVWDLNAAKEIWRSPALSSGYARAIALSDDGKWLAVGSSNGMVRIFDAANGKEANSFRLYSEEGSRTYTKSVAGKRVPFVRSGTIQLAFSGDGKRLVTAHDGVPPARAIAPPPAPEKVPVPIPVKKMPAAPPPPPRPAPLPPPPPLPPLGQPPAPPLAKLPAPKMSKQDHAFGVWDVATGDLIREFPGHADDCLSLALSKDGKRLITVGADQSTRIWDVDSGKELCRLASLQGGGWAVFDAAGRYDASNPDAVEGVHWVVANETFALGQLKDRLHDPGLLAKHMGLSKEPLRRVAGLDEVSLYPEVEAKLPSGPDTKLTLHLTNRGGGIGRVQVFVNGKQHSADARGAKFDVSAAKATLVVDLPAVAAVVGQKSQVRIVVWNVEGYLANRGLDLDWTLN